MLIPGSFSIQKPGDGNMAGKTMYFRVKAGKHLHSDGKTYTAGQIIESDEDIRKKWANKFDKVHTDELPAAKKALKRQKKAEDEARSIPEREDPGAELEGEGRPTTMDAMSDEEDDEEEDEKDLDEEEDDSEEAPAKKAAKRAADEEDEEEDDESPEKSLESELGEDVSEDYPDAGKASLLVLKKGRNFFIAKEDDPDTALNKKALKSTEIKSFIKDQRKKK
jgi:hypothetical protein